MSKQNQCHIQENVCDEIVIGNGFTSAWLSMVCVGMSFLNQSEHKAKAILDYFLHLIKIKEIAYQLLSSIR